MNKLPNNTIRVFMDTEFINTGEHIELVSIGMVDEYNNEYYGVSNEFDASKANDFVREIVLPKLPPFKERKPLLEIRREIQEFIGYKSIQLYLYYGAHDYILFKRLMGEIWPDGTSIPQSYIDLNQMIFHLYAKNSTKDKVKFEYPPKGKNAHNSLVDARWTKKLFENIQEEWNKPWQPKI